MNPEFRPEIVPAPVTSRRNRSVAGAALIGIGVLVLAGQMVETSWFGLLFLPVLGLIFLLWGAATRNVGPLIPGGILSGIGTGVFLIEGPLQLLQDEPSGGVFLLSFGVGWVLITLLSALFTDETHRWPLIPGGILALIGGSLLVGGVALDAVSSAGEILNRLWPVALVAFGLYLFLRPDRAKE